MRTRTKILTVPALLLLACTLGASEFDWMVRQISRETGVQPVHIPFFGVARFVVHVGHPAGASDLHLAVFEDTHVTPVRFNSMLDSTVGPAWNPIVRVRSRNGESTNIYAREEGKHLRLLICTSERTETTLVEVRIQPDRLVEVVEEQRQRHH
jgi:hypothetical protein